MVKLTIQQAHCINSQLQALKKKRHGEGVSSNADEMENKTKWEETKNW